MSDFQGALKSEIETDCVVCGNKTDFSSFLKKTKKHPAYVKCRVCGLVFERPQTQYDVRSYWYTPRHDHTFALDTRLANYRLRYEVVVRYASTQKPRVLDIGTSEGIFLKFLKLHGVDALGLELNQKAVEFGRREYGVEILNLSLEELNHVQEYDIVTLFNVFEHLEDPVSVLAKIRTVSRPNALLVLEIPNIFTPQAMIFRGHWHHFQHTHRWFFNRKTIGRLLEENGYSVVHSSFIAKIVTLARPFWLLGWVFGIFLVFKGLHVRMRKQGRIYHYLDRKRVRINIGDYLLVVARKIGA